MLHHHDKNFISTPMRDILLAHVDNTPVPIIRPDSIEDPKQRERAGQLIKSATALVSRGLIRCNRSVRPTHTIITEAGHVVLRKVLAEYAEILVRSGYRVEEIKYRATVEAEARTEELREVAAGAEAV